jgi:hypothetical protein
LANVHQVQEQHDTDLSTTGKEQGSEHPSITRRTMGAAAAAAVAGLLNSAAALPAYALKTVGICPAVCTIEVQSCNEYQSSYK